MKRSEMINIVADHIREYKTPDNDSLFLTKRTALDLADFLLTKMEKEGTLPPSKSGSKFHDIAVNVLVWDKE